MPTCPDAGLPTVRRFEAAGFRAWPAASVHYDGTWVIRAQRRLSGQAAELRQSARPRRRRDIAERVARAARRFDAYGRPLTFRLSPLSGPAADAASRRAKAGRARRIAGHARCRSTSAGGRCDGPDSAEGHRPVHGRGDATCTVTDATLRPGLTRGHRGDRAGSRAVRAGTRTSEPLATAICVHDGDLAGLFEIATGAARARQGAWPAGRAVGAEMGAAARRQAGLAAGRGRQRRRGAALRGDRLRRDLSLSLPPADGG